MKNPVMEMQQGYESQKLGRSPLLNKYLNTYYIKDDGCYSDMVFDFFFNGYKAITTEGYVPPNNESHI